MNRSSEPGKPNAAQSEIAQHGPVAHAGDAVGYGFAAEQAPGRDTPDVRPRDQ